MPAGYRAYRVRRPGHLPSHVIGAAAELCRQRGIEAILSIGGGSAPHTAKLVVYLSKSPGWLDDVYGIYLATGERLPLLRAATTAGRSPS
ncbi:iron-containing alcohol dehydrogenase [Rhizobium anhuiense]|uniref:Iron-containing alcohol dehydrogenase n=1 Tax=Rhizobium anhuiense TaxID=1184720 RepID=A0A432NA31_9HYPH|nr:iron-containing alcohol dehydrogenase [Rhizobium sp. WYCCWR 11146]RUL96400.1 iron-containing alcohol dehydrogenase [Rhizobium anhuiense]